MVAVLAGDLLIGSKVRCSLGPQKMIAGTRKATNDNTVLQPETDICIPWFHERCVRLDDVETGNLRATGSLVPLPADHTTDMTDLRPVVRAK